MRRRAYSSDEKKQALKAAKDSLAQSTKASSNKGPAKRLPRGLIVMVIVFLGTVLIIKKARR